MRRTDAIPHTPKPSWFNTSGLSIKSLARRLYSNRTASSTLGCEAGINTSMRLFASSLVLHTAPPHEVGRWSSHQMRRHAAKYETVALATAGPLSIVDGRP